MTEFSKLTPADEAWQIFREQLHPKIVSESIRVVDALDRVLVGPAVAPQQLPTFVRSTADGYAVRSADVLAATQDEPLCLEVVAEVPMGQRTTFSLGAGEAALIHTGGMVPDGSDAVIMIENTSRIAGFASSARPLQQGFETYRIGARMSVAAGENCIQPGEDVKAGDLILAAGRKLRPQDLGGLLAVGITRVAVARRPRVAIVSQGDEVVPPEQEPAPGQVRDINTYTLAALVTRAGGIPLTYPIAPDRESDLNAAVRRAFEEADMVVVTAGSSVSYRDLTPNAISQLGKPGVLVHGVALRPGKPTILAVCDGKPVFGLPGNPVSCINIFQYFALPTLRLMTGAEQPREHLVKARLEHFVPPTHGRADFVRVRLEERDGEMWAIPVFGKSNLIFTLVRSEGVIEVPLESDGIAAGTQVIVRID